MSTQPPRIQKTGQGFLLSLAAAASLSVTAIIIRYLIQTYQLPPLILAFWRNVFVGLTLLAILGIFKPQLLRLERRHLLFLAVFGLILATFNAFWTQAVALNGAAIATVLSYSSAAFTVLLARWLLKESLIWVKIVAVVLCLGGCVLVSGSFAAEAWRTNLWGILTGVLSGLCYAGYSLMGRSAAQRGLNPWTSMFYTFTFAALYLLIVNLLPGEAIPGSALQFKDLFWLKDQVIGWGLLFFLAAGPTLAGFGLYNVSLGYLPSSVANLIMSTEPVFTLVVAYFILGEKLNWIQALGSLVILSGVVILRIHERSQAGKVKIQQAD
jgi:drug/metabolite transporter (DMT)-like permease